MDLIQPLVAIVFVGALLGGVLLVLKKRGGVALSGTRRMELIERLPLGPQHALHLVRLGDHVVLVATAPSSCQVIEKPVAIGENP